MVIQNEMKVNKFCCSCYSMWITWCVRQNYFM